MTHPIPASGRKRLLCFGDSNTYGYDPRSYFGGRYDAPWPSLLRPEWEVLNAGRNGRTIPHRPAELEMALSLPDRCGAPDVLAVLLGVNDLLQSPHFTAGDVTARMERFLSALLLHPDLQSGVILLLAPSPLRRGTWVTEDRLVEESARLGSCYRALARRLGIAFADAGDIPLAFDGVHFTEEGHRIFARRLTAVLEALLP